jgi:hypothetical protein
MAVYPLASLALGWTLNHKMVSPPSPSTRREAADVVTAAAAVEAMESKARFEAYNRLQAMLAVIICIYLPPTYRHFI